MGSGEQRQQQQQGGEEEEEEEEEEAADCRARQQSMNASKQLIHYETVYLQN